MKIFGLLFLTFNTKHSEHVRCLSARRGKFWSIFYNYTSPVWTRLITYCRYLDQISGLEIVQKNNYNYILQIFLQEIPVSITVEKHPFLRVVFIVTKSLPLFLHCYVSLSSSFRHSSNFFWVESPSFIHFAVVASAAKTLHKQEVSST